MKLIIYWHFRDKNNQINNASHKQHRILNIYLLEIFISRFYRENEVQLRIYSRSISYDNDAICKYIPFSFCNISVMTAYMFLSVLSSDTVASYV